MNRIHPRRSAFTLVELLVVMAVIAVLVSLILAGVMAVRRKGTDVANRNDILQLSEGLATFYAKYKFYPPDHIKLCSKWSSYNPANAVDAMSMSYLNSMWSNLDRSQTFNWGGGTPFPEGVVLHGDQCLVFFLGGLPTAPGQPPLGFFNNPANPTVAVGASTERVKFFSFEGGRCVNIHPDGVFPSYLDGHAVNNDGVTRKKSPFLYFSSGKRPDGYGKTGNSAFGVLPYVQLPGPPIKFYNSTSFQLISAGPDGMFGPGGLWAAGGAITSPFMIDDVSNFYDRGLGY